MDGGLTALRRLASGQDGQFATGQARRAGVTPSGLRTLRDTGETTWMRRGVWRFTASPGGADAAVTAYLACWPYAVVSHRSAARHHGLTRVLPPSMPEVTVPYGTHRVPPGIVVHRSRELPPQDVLRVGQVRYTSVARTVCDLADGGDPWETLALCDDAVARGAKPRWIHARAEVLANGRSGVRLVRDATAPRSAAAFRSWLERVSAHVYRVAGLPEPAWNVPVFDEDGRIGVVDALWRPWLVIAETEGLRFHTTPAQRRADARRFNRLDEAGHTARRFTWEDVVHRPVDVAATVARALAGRGADVDLARMPRHIDLPAAPYA